MADFVFNIAKGRVAELCSRVDLDDPSASTIVIVVIDANGDTDAAMKDRETLSALLGGTANEVTNTNYARKTLTQADIATFAADHTNDRVDIDFADQTWSAIAAGTAWTDLIVCYSPSAGADTTIVPLTCHDCVVTPDGSDIVATIAAAGFFRAS